MAHLAYRLALLGVLGLPLLADPVRAEAGADSPGPDSAAVAELTAARSGSQPPPEPTRTEVELTGTEEASDTQLVQADPAPSDAEAMPAEASEAMAAEASSDEQPKQALPYAPDVKGTRPRVNPELVTPAATELQPSVEDLPAPDSLALPTKPEQVVIEELRPLSLSQVENLAEVNNPNLKAIASQVDQAQSNLRAEIARWYPTLDLQANALPTYNTGRRWQNLRTRSNEVSNEDQWTAALGVRAEWDLINPQRNPSIAAARDTFEKAKYQYVIALRELRLQSAQAYFVLQQRDDQVRIGQQSVRASLVSLRDSRARFQAGVATRLEVLEAETQLARDQQLLTTALAEQSIARRALAALLDLPQNVTPTAADPSRVLGVWQPSLQESIVAAYAFREELDQVLLDISIANSQANVALGAAQPFLSIFAGFDTTFFDGDQGSGDFIASSGGAYDTSVGLSLRWRLFDGGAAAANARQNRQLAQENTFRFAERRDAIRQEVEQSFYNLDKNNRNITTTAREVISARESLRLARLRFQAGVTTQREVVDNQRDLTQAEVRYADAITEYNVNLAELRRTTGLDQITTCPAQSLSPIRPELAADIPVEPTPLLPACQASIPGPV
ncbi:outer membrane efflux protein [Cyanobium sp. PCC 7001]|uniref:TolC family protein n=1 Tax=Cyanobium sp. PCC 7001 TaxID=180281 RepID=UPI0001804CA4|nr:outer membrane efflux protein [Cyanobium sp. PCC 7001]